MNAESLFISGTDTGVGKTLVTALIALHLQAQGMDVGVMKPFASGCIRVQGQLVSEDAQWLWSVTGVSDELELINPLRYEEPLAPLVAARRLGRDTSGDFAICEAAFKELKHRHDFVLVEGVGGLLVPLAQEKSGRILDCSDLAGILELPVVVVARRTLGTINHTLLTCRATLLPPSHFSSLVFCDAAPVADDDIAAQTSPDLICELTGLRCCGQVPFLTDLSRSALQRAAQSLKVPTVG
ncbi:MAG TPA: dethiobiotin synthase [Abditibacteriaceae bacterium]